MSVIFRIRPAGLLDGATVPVITSAVQDPLTGIYDVSFNSLNDNFGELDIQELFRIALGNRADDFLVPQLILTDGPATTVLELAKLAYSPAGAPAGVNRELLWEYIGAAPDAIGPKPFMAYTGQRLVLQSDNAVPGEAEIYLVAYPVTAGDLIDAICCTTPADAAAGQTGPAILPVADQNDGGVFDELAYKVEVNPGQSFTMLGANLDDIVSVAFVDVNTAGNGSPAPTVDSIVAGATSVLVNVDASAGNNGSWWGILLTDSAGNVYAAPSPLVEWLGE